jgi:hypothetical protein
MARVLNQVERARFERSRGVPEKPIHDVFPGLLATPVRIKPTYEPTPGQSHPTVYELTIMSAICANRGAKRLFEFGTFDGLTTLHLAMNTDDDAEITTIDLPPDDPVRGGHTLTAVRSGGGSIGTHFGGTPFAGKIRQLYGNTLEFDEGPFRNQADFIFVDAGHEYECVRSDTEKAFAMVAPGGVIVWHDYGPVHKGVSRCLDEAATSRSLAQLEGTALVAFVAGESERSPTEADRHQGRSAAL